MNKYRHMSLTIDSFIKYFDKNNYSYNVGLVSNKWSITVNTACPIHLLKAPSVPAQPVRVLRHIRASPSQPTPLLSDASHGA